jgi:hypothetical protein
MLIKIKESDAVTDLSVHIFTSIYNGQQIKSNIGVNDGLIIRLFSSV